VEAPFDTRNPDELFEKLKIINVNGGGDCSEMSISGLKIALEFALPNSLAYVFSDATAKDYAFYDEVVESIQRKQVQVNFLLTGDCDDQQGPGYKVYQKISRVSNGQVYDMKKHDVKDVLLAIKHTVSHNYAALKSVDIEKAGTTHTDLSVDKSISEISVSISGKNPTLSIKSPTNITITSNDELTLPNLKLINIKDPNDGIWKIEAGAESSHSLRLGAISDLQFEFGFSLNDATKKAETSFQPLSGQKNILTIFVSDPSLIEKLSNITIIMVSLDQIDHLQSFSVPLKKIQDDIYATESFEAPRQMFKIQLNGIDVHGNPIERLISTGLISSYGSK
jgi:von Willebrand factor A domain-containing protein 7